MTVTYDPDDPRYFDEADLRGELERVYDLCHGCRLCWNLCPSFPTLFDFVDAHDGDVSAMTPAEQDQVVDECYQCKLCYVKCPYIPPHEWQLDFPRLMLRAAAVRNKDKRVDLGNEFLGRTDLLGKLSTTAAPLVNRITGTPNSLPRRMMEKTVKIAADRVLPPYARQRFSTWFRKRPSVDVDGANGKVALFQTCLVEYQDPTIGHDLVKVCERNRISVDVPSGTVCCGMPWLDGGDVDAFRKQGHKNAAVLAEQVRAGRDVIVPQPTCGYVLKREYPDYLKTDDARLVAEHTYDAAEYLMKVHRERGGLDTEFTGTTPEQVAWHVPCHLQAQNVGFKSRDLMKLTGAQVTPIAKCSGIDGTWGYRKENYELSRKVARPLKDAIEKADATVVTGDCHLANGAIRQETGVRPQHPIQLLARAYGIPEEKQKP
jgi:glycerol-3-phosphate dehydrogenase subunit C